MKKTVLALAVLGAFASGSAMSATVTSSGSFFSISYDSSLVGLFGTPMIVGNTVQWFPSGSPGFSVDSAGQGIKRANSTFALQVNANPGYQISGFNLAEGGDYFFFGTGMVGTAVSGQLRVTPLAPASSTMTAAISPAGSFAANALLDYSTHNWTASASVGSFAPITAANVTVENLLFAYSKPSSYPAYAFIEKKDATLGVNVAPVPEAETYAMFLAGLGVMGAVVVRRRRQAAAA